MAISEKGVQKAKEMSSIKSGALGNDMNQLRNISEGIRKINADLKDPNISEAEKKDLKQKKKDILKRENMGEIKLKDGAKPDFLDFDKDGDKSESMKSALASKKTRTAKSGARTTMRGVKIAKKGYRKAKLS